MLASFIDDMREVLSKFPRDMTLGELVDHLPTPLKTPCRHCHQPIESYEGYYWRHGDTGRSRGCRAASYQAGRGWDDSVPERAHAQPERNWEAA